MASPLIFEPQRAPSLARFVESHISFLNEKFFFPFLKLFERHLHPLRSHAPRVVFGQGSGPKRALALWLSHIGSNLLRKIRRLSSAGRYTLGAQARGLHAELRGACNEQDQLDLALRPPNPIVAAQTARIRTGVRFFAVA